MDKNLTSVFSENLNERLKDPIIGAYLISFLITNWDLVLILVNLRADFHQNIYYIKANLAPIKIGVPSLNWSSIRGWHLLRFFIPLFVTYIWLLKWPKWTEGIFKNIHESKYNREKIISELELKKIEIKKEKLKEDNLVKTEELSLKEKSSHLWKNEFNTLLANGHLDHYETVAENLNNESYLNEFSNRAFINKYKNLALIDIAYADTSTSYIDRIKLTEKGEFFYIELLYKQMISQNP